MKCLFLLLAIFSVLVMIAVLVFSIMFLFAILLEDQANWKKWVLVKRFLLRLPLPKITPEQAKEQALQYAAERGHNTAPFLKGEVSLRVREDAHHWIVSTPRYVGRFVVGVDNQTGRILDFRVDNSEEAGRVSGEDVKRLARILGYKEIK